MSHNRAAIFFDNLIEAATVTATSEATASSGATLAGSNVQTFDPGKVWRSTDLADQTLLFSWTDEQFIPFVAIWRHIHTGEGSVRVRISNNSNLSSPTYDATFYVWPSIYGLEDLPLDFGGLDGAPIVDDLSESQFYSVLFLNLVYTGTATAGGAATITLPTTLTKANGDEEDTDSEDNHYANGMISITSGTGSGQSKLITAYNGTTRVVTVDSDWSTPPDATSVFEIDLSGATSVTANDYSYIGKYLGLTFSDPYIADGFMQVAWIGAGDYLQPTYDIGMDNESGWVDYSETLISANNNKWKQQQNKAQSYSFRWPHLTETEAKVRLKTDLGTIAGTSKPVVFCPFVENSFRAYTDTVIGYLESPPRIRQNQKNYKGTSYSCDLTITGEP